MQPVNTLTLTSTGALNSTGAINLTAGQLISLDGVVRDSGNLQVDTGAQAGADVLISGQITGASIQMQPVNTLTLTSTGALNSTGAINLTAGGAQVSGAMSGTNVTVASSGNLALNPGANLCRQ